MYRKFVNIKKAKYIDYIHKVYILHIKLNKVDLGHKQTFNNYYIQVFKINLLKKLARLM